MEDKAVRRALCEFIRALAVTERAVDLQRAVLAEVPGLDTRRAFSELTKLNADYITPSDLQSFLQLHKTPIDEASSIELARSLSKSGNINYDEFLGAIKLQHASASRQEPSGQLTYEFQYALARIFSKKLEGIKNIEFCRQELERQPQGIVKAYNMLAGAYPSGVTRDALHSFIRKYTTDLSLEDVAAVFENIDRDRDGVISLDEFVAAASPVMPFYKILPLPDQQLSSRYKSALAEASSVQSQSTESKSPVSHRSYHTIGLESPRKRSEYVSVTSNLSWKTPNFSDISSPAVKLPYILCQLMQRESEVAKIQQQLVSLPDFSPTSVFRLFDTKSYGNITLPELKQGLQTTQVSSDPRNLKLLFMRFDRDSDGRLSFSDFLPMIVPADYSSSPISKQDLSRDIMILTGRLFLLLQKNEGSLEDIRESLNPGEVHQFYIFLSRSTASVNEPHLKSVIQSAGFSISDDQSALLMRRLDHDGDGEVSYSDFLESFSRKLIGPELL